MRNYHLKQKNLEKIFLGNSRICEFAILRMGYNVFRKLSAMLAMPVTILRIGYKNDYSWLAWNIAWGLVFIFGMITGACLF